MSTFTATPDDSGNCSAMFAAMVDGLPELIRLAKVTRPRTRTARWPRPSSRQALAQAQHRPADDAGPAERQDRHADHLPPGGTERERRLLVQLGGLEKTPATPR